MDDSPIFTPPHAGTKGSNQFEQFQADLKQGRRGTPKNLQVRLPVGMINRINAYVESMEGATTDDVIQFLLDSALPELS